MRYQTLLGNCDTTTVNQLTDRCPETLEVFRKYAPEITGSSPRTIAELAAQTDLEPERLCQDLFDVYMKHNPLEDLDTETLLKLLEEHYDEEHLEQLPQLHRLARKIEAVHRTSPDVPKGLTLAVKKLAGMVEEHIRQENSHAFMQMKNTPSSGPEVTLAQLNEEHAHLKGQLGEIRALTDNYQPPESACRSWRRLYRELRSLDFRLSEQIYLERDILFPRFQF